MAKKSNFGPNFGSFALNLGPKHFFRGFCLLILDVRHCCKLSLYVVLRKNNEPNLRKWQKLCFYKQLSEVADDENFDRN